MSLSDRVVITKFALELLEIIHYYVEWTGRHPGFGALLGANSIHCLDIRVVRQAQRNKLFRWLQKMRREQLAPSYQL